LFNPLDATQRHIDARKSGRIRLIIILGALSAFGPLSTDMYLPSLPSLSHDFGTGAAQAQLTLSTCFLGLANGLLLSSLIGSCDAVTGHYNRASIFYCKPSAQGTIISKEMSVRQIFAMAESNRRAATLEVAPAHHHSSFHGQPQGLRPYGTVRSDYAQCKNLTCTPKEI
jgi:hypothetical protein